MFDDVSFQYRVIRLRYWCDMLSGLGLLTLNVTCVHSGFVPQSWPAPPLSTPPPLSPQPHIHILTIPFLLIVVYFHPRVRVLVLLPRNHNPFAYSVMRRHIVSVTVFPTPRKRTVQLGRYLMPLVVPEAVNVSTAAQANMDAVSTTKNYGPSRTYALTSTRPENELNDVEWLHYHLRGTAVIPTLTGNSLVPVLYYCYIVTPPVYNVTWFPATRKRTLPTKCVQQVRTRRWANKPKRRGKRTSSSRPIVSSQLYDDTLCELGAESRDLTGHIQSITHSENFVCQSHSGNKRGEKHQSKQAKTKKPVQLTKAQTAAAAKQAQYEAFMSHFSQHKNIFEVADAHVASLQIPDNTGDDLVFDKVLHDGKSMPTSLLRLTRTNVVGLLGSLTNYEPSAHTDPFAAQAHKEMKRALAAIGNWHLPDGLERLKAFLLIVWDDDSYRGLKPRTKVPPLTHQKYVKDPQLFMRHPAEKHFVSSTDDSGEIPPLLERDSEPNFIHNIVTMATTIGQQLTPQKLRSLLRDFVKRGESYEVVEPLLKSKMYAVRSNQKFDKLPPNALAWLLPYVHPEMMYYKCTQRGWLENYFKAMILDLRERILTFARNYMAMGKMTNAERKNVLAARSTAFVELLRSPAVQMLYAAGLTHTEVVEQVNTENIETLNRVMAKSDVVVDIMQKGKREKRTLMAKARQDKFDKTHIWEVDTFECQSLLSVVVEFGVSYTLATLCTTMLVYYSIKGATLLSEVHECLQNYNNVAEGAQRAIASAETIITPAANIADRIRVFGDALSNPLRNIDGLISPDEKLLLLELKSILHIFMHIWSNDLPGAIEWSTNFVVTRPEIIVNALRSLMTVTPQNVTRDAIVVHYEGVARHTSARNYMALTQAWLELPPDEYSRLFYSLTWDPVVTQGKFAISGMITGLFEALGLYSTAGMSDVEVRQASNIYAYVSHRKRNDREAVDSITEILSFVFRMVYGCDPFDVGFQRHASTLMHIIRFVEDCNGRVHYATDRAFMNKVLSVYKAATEAATNPVMASIPGFLVTRFNTALAALTRLHAEVSATLEGSHTRREPLMVLLTGPPGVGKSAFVKFATQGLSTIEGRVHDPQQTYVFDAATGYWEGYSAQPYVLMDDLYASTILERLTTESTGILRMINVAPYNLNMAFSGKGNTFFTSRYVFASTNIANDGIEHARFNVGLADEKAIERRLHLVIHRTETMIGKQFLGAEYRVDKCLQFPEMKGKYLNPVELVKLMKRCKDQQDTSGAGYEFTPAEMEELFKDCLDGHVPKTDGPTLMVDPEEDETENLEQLLDQFEEEETKLDTQSGAFGSLLTPAEFVEMGISLGVFGHWTPEAITRMQVFLAALTSVAAGAGLYYWFFGQVAPTLPQTVEDTFVESRAHKHKGGFQSNRPRHVKNGNRGVRKIVSKKQNWKHTYKHPEAVQRVIHPQSRFEGMLAGLCDSMVWIDAHSPTLGMRDECNGFHVANGYFCVPAHFFLRFLDYDDAVIGLTPRGKNRMEFPFPVTECVQIEGEDLFMFRVSGPGYQAPKSSINNFIDPLETPVSLSLGQPMFILSASDNTTSFRAVNITVETGAITYRAVDELFIVEDPIVYWQHTVAGDSGGLVVILDDDGKPRVVGMHVGRHNTNGVALPICKQDMMALMESFTVTQSSPSVLVTCGVADPPYFCPTKTTIHRSPLWEYAEPCRRIPVKLQPFTVDGVVIDPMQVAQAKLVQTPFISDEPVNPRVLEHLLDKYRRPPDLLVGPVSWEENLRGDVEKGSIGICHATSAGYPYCIGSGKGKAPQITNTPDEYGTYRMEYSTDYFSHIVSLDEKLRDGEPVVFYWIDVLKGELREREKVYAGKTRLIAAASLDALFLTRKYFLDFVTFVQKKAATHYVGVGINPHSVQWTILKRRLTRFEGSIVAGDYSNYDGKVPKKAGLVFLEMVNRWYDDGPINARCRATILENVWHATRICGTKMYKVAEGNPSGNPITSIYNSITNCVMLLDVLFTDLAFDEGEFDFSVYGDDNIIGTIRKDLTIDHFTEPIKRRYGMDITHFTKVAQEHGAPVDSIETVSYLGRWFRTDTTVTRAPLRLFIIIESTYWFGSKLHDDELLVAVTQSFMTELSHWDRATFDRESKRYLAAVQERMPHMFRIVDGLCHSYDWYYREMYDKGRIFGMYVQSAITEMLPSMVFVPQSRWTKNMMEITDAERDNVNTNDGLEYSSRAVNEPTVTQTVQLGDYHDTTEVTESAVTGEAFQSPYEGFNMEGFDLSGVLTREYPLTTINWVSTAAAGAVLATYRMPNDLLAVPYLAAKVKDFRYLKADVEWTFRVTTNAFNYGKLLVAYNPMPLHDVYDPDASPASLFEASGRPHILLSAAASEVSVFRTPMILPWRALDLNSYESAEMGHVRVYVLNALNSTSSSISPAQVFVTARFVDAQLFLPHDMVVQSLRGKEAAAKAKANSIAAAEEVTAPVRGIVTNTRKTVGRVFSNTLQAVTDAAALAMLGLSKPTTLQMGGIEKINTYADMPAGKGIDTSIKLAMDPECGISTEPIVGGASEDEMKLSYIMGTPTLITTYSILPATPAGSVVTMDAWNYNNGYQDLVTKNFAYWSGSTKIGLYIVASVFHQARVVFWLAEALPTGVTVPTSNWQNCYHKVMDISGDTEVFFTVPYMERDFAMDTTSGGGYALYCKVLAWNQPDVGLSNPIHINVYKSADSDYKVFCQKESVFVVQSNPRVDFNTSFEPMHPSMTGYTTRGVVAGEEYDTLREVMHRYTAISAISLANNNVWNSNSGVTGATMIGPEMWANMFRFWRGSIRMKILPKDNASKTRPVYATYYEGATQVNVLGSTLSSTLNPQVEIEYPYWDVVAFRYTDEVPLVKPTLYAAQSSGQSRYLYKAVGDDFSFHFLRLPPVNVVSALTAQPTWGQNGASAFFNTA